MKSNIFSGMAQVPFFYSMTLTLIFIFKVTFLAFFLFANKPQTVRDRTSMTIAIREEVMYLPSTGTTMKVVHRDLDLNFQGHGFLIVTTSIYQRITCRGQFKFIFSPKYFAFSPPFPGGLESTYS